MQTAKRQHKAKPCFCKFLKQNKFARAAFQRDMQSVIHYPMMGIQASIF